MKRKAQRARRETWQDWQGTSGPIKCVAISRRDLVEYAQNIGVDVTENDILYWQARRSIPYPVLVRHGRTAHAVYPFWFVELIVALRQMQQQGVVLRDIGPALRQLTPQIAKDGLPGFVPTPLRCKCCGQILSLSE